MCAFRLAGRSTAGSCRTRSQSLCQIRFLYSLYSFWTERKRPAALPGQDGLFLNYRAAMPLAELTAQHGASVFDRDPEGGAMPGCFQWTEEH